MRKIYFTAESADKCIPEITRKLKKLRKLNKATKFLNSLEVEHKDDLDDFYASVSINTQFHRLSLQFYSELKRMIKKGYLVKDLEKGLVDFYAMHKDKEIILCWKFGETNIRYWHTLYNGYRERKPISFLGNLSENPDNFL